MNTIPANPDKPNSCWIIDSDSRRFGASLREAELAVEQFVNQSPLLEDPIRQIYELPQSGDAEVTAPDAPLPSDPDVVDTVAEAREDAPRPPEPTPPEDPDVPDLPDVPDPDAKQAQQEEANDATELAKLLTQTSLCQQAYRSDAPIQRMAPSVHALDTNVNTIEVVKRNGLYYVVLDGVPQPTIKPRVEGGYDTHSYWMPRFKESITKNGKTGRYSRNVEPAVVSMRLEEYETAPEACVVEVRQTVTAAGTVVMDAYVIASKPIKPYSASGIDVQATVVPYPMICTPSPYFCINDYSKLHNIEVLAKLFYHKDFFDSVMYLLGMLRPDRAIRKLGFAARVLIFNSIRIMTGTLITSGDKAAKAAVLAGLTGLGIPAAMTAAAGGAVYGAATYGVWQMVQAAKWLRGRKYDEVEANRIFDSHAPAAMENPGQHIIKMQELPKVLRRIAETRANGTIRDRGENTVGMTVHDLHDMGWKREAALLQYLINGEGERKGRDPITGRYSTGACLDHVKAFKASPYRTPLTFNTISVAGMDPIGLAKTRIQFSFVIRIKEQDGSNGPTIRIDATRMNGIDAGWIAGGFDTHFADVTDACNCLEARLMSLPGVGLYMRAFSTLVADTNNGVIVGEELDPEANALLGRHVDDKLAAANTPERVEQARSAAAERRARIEGTLTETEKKLLDLRSKEKDNRENIRKATKEADRQRREANAKYYSSLRATPRRVAAHRDALNKKLASIDKAERASLQTLRREANGLYSDIYGAEEAKNRESQLLELQRTREATAAVSRKFANIFDYDKTMQRLRSLIVGRTYDSFDDAESAAAINQARSEALWARGFWRRLLPQNSSKYNKHVERCHKHVCANLGIHPNTIKRESVMVLRFIVNNAPLRVDQRDPKAMRFTAFVVPRAKHWRPNMRVHEVTRILPQIMRFDLSRVSRFGRLTIVTPKRIDESDLQNRPLAAASVDMARSAMTRNTSLFDVDKVQIYEGMCHFAQVYHRGPTWASKHGVCFSRQIGASNIPIHMTCASMLPAVDIARRMIKAEGAGRESLERALMLTAGENRYGIAALLSEMRIRSTVSSVFAMATFSEIVSYHAIDYGSTPDTLERQELVKSAFSRAKSTAALVARFVSASYVDNVGAVYRMPSRDDIAFYCIPGIGYTRIALGHLGILSTATEGGEGALAALAAPAFASAVADADADADASIPKGAWTSVNKIHAADFSTALLKLSTLSRFPIHRIPFTCIQSVTSTLAKAVGSVMGTHNAVHANIVTCTLAFERVKIMVETLSGVIPPRAVDALLVDVVCSYPIVLKAVHVNEGSTAVVSARASMDNRQRQWEVKRTRVASEALAYRLAHLRLEVQEDAKKMSVFQIRSALDLADYTNARGTRQLTKTSATDFVATYMVPYGCLFPATTKDILHIAFDVKTVWVESLLTEVKNMQLFTSDTGDYISKHTIAVDAVQQLNAGQDMHPYMIQTTEKAVRLYLAHTKNIRAMYGYMEGEINYGPLDRSSLVTACKDINASHLASNKSGELSQLYAKTMHNAERLFQALAVVAARNDMAAAGNETRAAIATVPRNYHAAQIIACACIANSLCDTEIGSVARLSVAYNQVANTNARASLNHLARVCQALVASGVKAVPFREICMCVATL